MAGIGLKQFVWAPLKDDNRTYDITDNKLKRLAGAIESSLTFNFNEAQLAVDDLIQEDVKEFKDGDLTLGIDDDNDVVFNDILGKAKGDVTDTENPESISNVSDVPKYVGFSQIITKLKNNVKLYKVEFLPKVKFAPFTSGAKTKGASLEFTTPSVTGKIYANAEGVYEKHQTFDTYEKAVAYQKKCFGITENE